MTSFDALEAIQTDSAEVTLRVASADLQPRDVSLRRAYTTKNPVKYKLVKTFFFGEWPISPICRTPFVPSRTI